MRLAVVSDIHGNLPALEAVLEDIAASGVDMTVNLGDILSGPLWVAETAERLMALELPTIRGNHERQLLTLAPARMGASDAFAAQRLIPAQRAWLEALPLTRTLGDAVFCCHGTPDSDLHYFLETVTGGEAGSAAPGVRAATPDEAAERAGAVAHTLILCGHTHMPRALQLNDGRLIVNPGSVGMPMALGSTDARYAVLEKLRSGWTVGLRAIPYDHPAAARQALEQGFPNWADAVSTGWPLPRGY